MKKYWVVFTISIQSIFEYRFNFLIHTLKYASMVILTALVWIAVLKEKPNLGYSLGETIAYYIYAAILYSFSNFHTWYIEHDIKLGGLSKYLLKPISPFFYYFNVQSADLFAETLFKAFVFIPILFATNLMSQISWSNLLILSIFLPIVFFFSFSIFSFISTFSFWLTEVYSIRWALTIVFRFLSGMIVPISFFPDYFQQISFYLPFQHLVFTPIRLIQNKITLDVAIQSLVILLIWSGILTFLRIKLWNKGVNSYEGTGI